MSYTRHLMSLNASADASAGVVLVRLKGSRSIRRRDPERRRQRPEEECAALCGAAFLAAADYEPVHDVALRSRLLGAGQPHGAPCTAPVPRYSGRRRRTRAARRSRTAGGSPSTTPPKCAGAVALAETTQLRTGADDEELERFLLLLGRRAGHLRPGLRLVRTWDPAAQQALGGARELVAAVREAVNAVLKAAGEPELPIIAAG